jgi:hypothetical protein
MHAPNTSLILIDDFARMFKHTIDTNERPYQRQAKEYFNALVEEWETKISPTLLSGSLKKQVPTEKAYDTLVLLVRGKELKALYKTDFNSRFKRQSKEDIGFFVDFILTSDIGQLIELGRNTVQKIWVTIITYLTDYRDEKQYKKIYAESDDPLVWKKKQEDNLLVLSPDYNPFDLTDEKLSNIRARVDVVISQYPPDF